MVDINKSVQDVQDNRDFPGSDINMLRAALVVVSNFNLLSSEIIVKRPTWAAPYISNIEEEIMNAFGVIGTNPKKALSDAVRQIVVAQLTAILLLGDFKNMIEQDFKEHPRMLFDFLRDLGFNDYWHEADKNHSQGALMNLLITFKANCTPELIDKVETAGMTPGLCQQIIDLAEPFIAKQAIKEPLKTSTKILTAEDIKVLNNVYASISKICNICQRIFLSDKVKQQMFSYRHILRLMVHQNDNIPPAPPQA